MPRKIESLFRRQRSGALDVIALHRHLAKVVQERRCVQRSAIVPREMKLLRDLIRDNRDALRVRVLVALELIGRLRELYESLSRRAIDQLCLDWFHDNQFLPQKAQKAQTMKESASSLRK
jgi:hypothetical protein